MLHLPFSLMNRLNKIESAFSFLDAVFPKDSFIRFLRDNNFCRCAVWRHLNSPRSSIKCFNIYIVWAFGTVGYTTFLRGDDVKCVL